MGEQKLNRGPAVEQAGSTAGAADATTCNLAGFGRGAQALLAEFFAQDNLANLAAETGALLGCPLLVLDDTYHIAAHYCPLGFSDELFQKSVASGEITYEAGAIISRSEALMTGEADYVKLEGSPYTRRFTPLISSGVQLGYLICVDLDGHLPEIPKETWNMVEQILAKQAFIEASRQDKPFETAEDVLMHLLDGGFSSASYFKLQASGTYLADFHPAGFALIDMSAYHDKYFGKRRLKDEINERFPKSHSFLYRGDVFLFLHGKEEFEELAEEFQLKVVLAEGIEDLFDLPKHYGLAREALELMTDSRFGSAKVCTLEKLRVPLVLKKLEDQRELIPKELQALAANDREKDTQYCETLYYYLTCSRSLKKTCDALFTHRNTVLYRIHRMQDDFLIPLDEPAMHVDLLIGISLILFEEKGPDFFVENREGNSYEGE